MAAAPWTARSVFRTQNLPSCVRGHTAARHLLPPTGAVIRGWRSAGSTGRHTPSQRVSVSTSPGTRVAAFATTLPLPEARALTSGAGRAAGSSNVAAAAAPRRGPLARRASSTGAAAADFDGPAASGSNYDAAANAAYWARRPVPVLGRLLRISTEFGVWYLSSRRHADSRRSAAELRDVLTRLGPAFVKIGQALSSRPDVLPPDFLVELEKLQDRIPPFDDAAALEVMAAELGAPLGSVFAELSESPVAAASLGQVYKARLRGGGAEVAIKVQRPGVVEAIALDTYILRYFAGALRTARRLNTDLPALVDEWASSLYRELDYRQEAANAQRFARLFAHMPDVVVPRMYPELTTSRVMVMEWIEGVRLRSASQQQQPAAPSQQPAAAAATAATGTPSTRPPAASPPRVALSPSAAEDLRLVEIGVRCSLEQMLEEGFYHADPHPGNLLKTRDGRLAYLDFGMMGEIDEDVRGALVRATLHMVNREYGALAEDFIALGLLPPGSDLDEVIPSLTGVFQEALAGGVSNLSFGQLSGNLGRTMYQYQFRIPAYYTLLVRSLSVLEGIALAADPSYKVLGAAYPWISRRLLTQPSPELRDTLRRLLYKGGRFQFERLEQLLEQAARARASRRSAGPVPQRTPAAAAAAPGAPAAGSAGGGGEALALLLSPEGRFVRGMLEDELAKGLDAGWRLAADALVEQADGALARLAAALPQLAALTGVRAGGGSSGGGAAAAGVVQSLLDLPRLATEEDVSQVQGISRLAAALAQLSAARQQETGAVAAPPLQLPGWPALGALSLGAPPGDVAARSEAAALVESAQQASAALAWLASEVAALPPALRQEALTIPVSVASKLSSRLAARAIKATLGSGGAASGSRARGGAANGGTPNAGSAVSSVGSGGASGNGASGNGASGNGASRNRTSAGGLARSSVRAAQGSVGADPLNGSSSPTGAPARVVGRSAATVTPVDTVAASTLAPAASPLQRPQQQSLPAVSGAGGAVAGVDGSSSGGPTLSDAAADAQLPGSAPTDNPPQGLVSAPLEREPVAAYASV